MPGRSDGKNDIEGLNCNFFGHGRVHGRHYRGQQQKKGNNKGRELPKAAFYKIILTNQKLRQAKERKSKKQKIGMKQGENPDAEPGIKIPAPDKEIHAQQISQYAKGGWLETVDKEKCQRNTFGGVKKHKQKNNGGEDLQGVIPHRFTDN